MVIVKVISQKKRRQDHFIDEEIDEIEAYCDGRYICGSEAAYRIYDFPIHQRTLFVERLPFHLPQQKNCTFRANESLEKVAERGKYRFNKLETFFHLNSVDDYAIQYTYDQIPQHYVWNDGKKK